MNVKILKIRYLLLLLGVILIGISSYILFSPIYKIRNVIITGNHRISRNEIIQYMSFNYGEHILSFSINDLEKILTKDPRIAWVDVNRNYPDEISVHIIEEHPVVLLCSESIWGLTEDGKLLPIESPYQIPNIPIISGVEPEIQWKPYDYVESDRIKNGLEFYKFVRRFSPYFLDMISEIYVEDCEDIAVILKKDGLLVHMGDDEYEKRVKRLELMLKELGMDRVDVREIDLRYSSQAVVKLSQNGGSQL